MNEDRRVQALIQEAQSLRYSRRQVLRRAAIFGLSASGIATVLAACGNSSTSGTASTGKSGTTTAATSSTGSSAGTTAGGTKAATPASAGAASPASLGTPVNTTSSGKSGFSPNQSQTSSANIKGQNLSMLMNTYFVAAAQDYFTKLTNDWGAANGVKVTVDYVAWPDIQAKIGAAIQSGSGPDIIQLQDTWPYLYYQNLVEIDDLSSDIGAANGGYFDWVVKTASVNNKWYSVPIGASGSAFTYRMSYLQQAGASTFPDTWEELFAVGKKLKAMGKPIGQALGHSTGDPVAFCYPYMWAYGAMEVQADGKTVAFNQPQFVDGMAKFIQGWKDGFDETGLGWDDASNNKAFLADQISATLNGSSIYIAAMKDNPALAKDINHAQYPKGPAGRFNQLGSNSYAIAKYSKNQEAAKEFLKYFFSDKPYGDWIHIQQGYQLAATQKWSKDPVYSTDPKLAPYGNLVQYARTKGYAGPSNQAAALAFSKYIIVDTFARAVQSGNAQDAISWGTDQLKQIYK